MLRAFGEQLAREGYVKQDRRREFLERTRNLGTDQGWRTDAEALAHFERNAKTEESPLFPTGSTEDDEAADMLA